MGKVNRTRGQYNARLSDDEVEKLAIIAEKFEYMAPATVRDRVRPSIPQLIRAIANGDLKLARNTRR